MSGDDGHAGQAAPRLQALLLSIVSVQIAVVAYTFYKTLVPRTFLDAFSWVSEYLQTLDGVAFPAYLWKPHNEHHMPLIRLAVASDIRFFAGLNLTLIALSVLAIAATLLTILAPNAGDRARAKLLLCRSGLIVGLLVTVPAIVDCSVAINAPYPITVFFTVASFAMASRSNPRPWTVAATIILGVLASGANATGLLVWPIIIWTAWRGRWPKPALAIVFGVGTAYSAFYVATMDPGGPRAGIPTALKMAEYGLAFLGLPLSRAAALAVPARLLGAALLLASVIILVRDLFAKAQNAASHRFGVALILFTLLTAGLAAIGRADLEPEVKLPVRYALFVVPLHIGLLLVAYPGLAAWANTPARETRVQQAALVLAAILLGLQLVSAPQAIAASNRFNAALDAFAAGSRDGSLEPLVFPNLDFAQRVQQDLATYEARR